MNILEYAIAKKMFGGSGGAQEQSGIVGKSWESLVNEGHIHIDDGAIWSNYNNDDDENSSAEDIVGHLVIPEGITCIDVRGFAYCYLSEVTLPESIYEINELAFCACRILRKINGIERVKSLLEGAFTTCSCLDNITLNDDIIAIPPRAFQICENLTNINFPNKLEIIDYEAFYECYSLPRIDIPASVNVIGERAFRECYSLTDIYFKGTVDEWNAITFGDNWNMDVPATEVICADGTVSLQ